MNRDYLKKKFGWRDNLVYLSIIFLFCGFKPNAGKHQVKWEKTPKHEMKILLWTRNHRVQGQAHKHLILSGPGRSFPGIMSTSFISPCRCLRSMLLQPMASTGSHCQLP